jgi:hypothetical protein
MGWTLVFVGRQFRGLFLQITLPGAHFAARHALGTVELLTLDRGRVTCFDQKLRPVCTVYPDLIASGVFPRADAADAFAFLTSLLGVPPQAFLLSDRYPERIHPFLAPVPLARLLNGPAPGHIDARYPRWTVQPTLAPATTARFADLLRGRDAELADYIGKLARALGATCGVTDCDVHAASDALRTTPTWKWLAQLHPSASS